MTYRASTQFGFRDTETFRLEPLTGHLHYAVMMARVPSLPEPSAKIALHGVNAGAPVESLAIIGALRGPHGWQWLQLCPEAKEILGHYMSDHGALPDTWYHLVLEPKEGVDD